MAVLLPFEEKDSHTGCNDYNDSSHHLVDTCCALGESDEHQSWPTDITSRWDSKQKWVNISLKLLLLSLLPSWTQRHVISDSLVGLISLLPKPLAKINNQTSKFSDKHVCTLKVGMSKSDSLPIFICSYDHLILGLHYNCVARSKKHHWQHDSIQLPIRNHILLSSTHI